MSFIEVKLLILAQIAMDCAIIIVFIFLIRRLRHLHDRQSLNRAIEIFDSILTDADKVAVQFNEQLEEKHRLIKHLDEQLDKKIVSLNLLLSRSEAQLNHDGWAGDAKESPFMLSGREKEILRLADAGRDLDTIARMLAIPKEEVRLTLSVKKRLSRIDIKEGVS